MLSRHEYCTNSEAEAAFFFDQSEYAKPVRSAIAMLARTNDHMFT
jgi:hypothetical protein